MFLCVFRPDSGKKNRNKDTARERKDNKESRAESLSRLVFQHTSSLFGAVQSVGG